MRIDDVKTWNLQTTLDSSGHLHLEVPVADGPQDVEVVLVVSPREAAERRPNWEVVEACLGTLQLTEDPVAWQRRERSAWSN